MKSVRVLAWTVECDKGATRTIHQAMDSGAAEDCTCQGCRNFSAARHLAYPDEALEIFSELGIRSDRESNISLVTLPSGKLWYDGWFHFVGKILQGPEPRERVAEIPPGGDIGPGVVQRIVHQKLVGDFQIGLIEKRYLLPPQFDDKSVVQLEFMTELPWVLEEPLADG